MNAITTRAAGRPMTAPVLVEPRLSQRLSIAIRDILDPPPCNGIQAVVVPAETMPEAMAALAAYRVICKGATPDQIRRWLMPLNAAVRNPQTDDDFDLRAVGIAAACIDIPTSCLTVAAQRDAMRTFQFFPGAADVYALLRTYAAPLLANLRALEKLTTTPAAEVHRPITQAEIDAVAAKFRDDMNATAAERARNTVAHSREEAMRGVHLSHQFNGPTGEKLAAIRAGNPFIAAALAEQAETGDRK